RALAAEGGRVSQLELRALTKRFPDGNLAVDAIDLSIESGEFVVLLGPSGCGKTTTLRMIAGLELPTSGTITQGGRDVTCLRPSERDVGFVFQFYALYPHMSVAENIAFPLECAGMARAEREERALQVAQRLGLRELLRSRPRQLSGGDQQRVALARAMVRKPAVYLMDEPLGTLDGGRRLEMCEFLREQQLANQVTTVYVTHDQEEAMRLADRVVVMSAGKILQAASPAEVYDQPANRFVAHFVGSPGMNFIAGERVGEGTFRSAGADLPFAPRSAMEGLSRSAVLGIRPEFLRLTSAGTLRGRVTADLDLGASRALYLDTALGPLIARIPSGAPATRGEEIRFDLDPAGLRWFSAQDGARIA
ncbi:MAG TPA: ABC transporter ATP-binding protein, partial [Planctomycetota bacterium]|nr:ABC transporter ATP-binding protein [Planctomycetota bacterium]